MKTAGQILKSTRLSKKLELDEISRITKIRPHFIESIEADDYRNLPSGTVARGFIRNYSEILELNPSYILAIFRRDFIENPSGRIVPRGMFDPVEKVSFWTPRSTVIAGVCVIFSLFAAYLIYQYHLLTGPPSLTLVRPSDNIIVSNPNIEVVGRTDPEASLTVNSQLFSLDKNGWFSFRFPLTPGKNILNITAQAKSGKTSTISRNIILTSTP